MSTMDNGAHCQVHFDNPPRHALHQRSAAVPELMRLKEDVDRNSGTNFMVGFLDKKAKPERGEAYHWQRR